MFCPRCGRPVNAEANFCGGCGLSRVEIEKYIKSTAPQQPAAEAPQPETAEPVAAEPVFTEPEAVKTEEPKAAEPVFTEPESVKAEESSFAQTEAPKEAAQPSYADNNCTYAYSYKKADEPKTESQHSYTSAADAAYTVAPSAEQTKNEAPLSTVDFIWMLVISSLPVIGLVYLIYLAVQDNNTNKRSFARATLIVSLFSIVIALVFAVGVIAAGLF